MAKTRSLGRILVVLVLALAAGYLNFLWMAGRGEAVAVAEKPQTAPVIVAVADLPAGTKLNPDMLRVAQYPLEAVPSGVFSTHAELDGRILAAPIAAREPVGESRLAPAHVKAGGMTALVAPGKRAMAVKGNEVLGMSGLIGPGHKVDVLVTLSSGGSGQRQEAKLVLSNVPVLATGTVLEPTKDGKNTSPVDVYTLEVTPEESEVLALASTLGRLHFALRNFADVEPVLTSGADVKTTLASHKPKARPAAGARYRKVEVISGGQSKTHNFAQ